MANLDLGERVFVRGMTSEYRGIGGFRRQQHGAPRVRRAIELVENAVDEARSNNGVISVLSPGDEPFLTQSLQVHYKIIPAGGFDPGHAHQNETVFFVLEGQGWDVHDGVRHDWREGDLVVEPVDNAHGHFNASKENRVLKLNFRARSLWMFLGLLQQGKDLSRKPANEELYGVREDWSRLWTAGVKERKEVLSIQNIPIETTRDGRVRIVSSLDRQNLRLFSMDLYQQEILEGESSGRHWHMADEVLYILRGSGYSLHWAVEAEMADRYYARIALKPSRWEFKAGDLVYIPPNTVHQHFNSDSEELVFLSAQNRIFKHLGYNAVAYPE